MSPCKLLLSALLSPIFLIPVVAQVNLPGRPTGPEPPSRRQKQQPCWEVAGISKSAIEQRHTANEQARQQIEAVCANSSLTVAQKHQEIRAIREREKQEVEALITPQQQEALRACQESRGHVGHGGSGMGGGHGMGPCGEMPSAPPGKTPTRPEPQD